MEFRTRLEYLLTRRGQVLEAMWRARFPSEVSKLQHELATVDAEIEASKHLAERVRIGTEVRERRDKERTQRQARDREAARTREREAPRARDRKALEDLVRQKRIKRVVHFTTVRNALSIGVTGRILTRANLDERKDLDGKVDRPDARRVDARLNGVCLSIEFPNYQMFFKKRIEYRGWSWVVLVLAPAVLWEGDCLFFPENAAKKEFHGRLNHQFRGPDALRGCFADEELRTKLKLPCFFPTNPQCETIVLGDVSTRYVTAIVLEEGDDAVAQQLRCHFRTEAVVPQSKARTEDRSEPLFSYRRDWEHWKAPTPPEGGAETDWMPCG